MKYRVQTWKRGLCFAICATGPYCVSLAAPLAPPPPPEGITQAAENEAAQALDLFNSGKLQEAADAYADLLKKYPNSGTVPEALFRLGYIQYVQGDYPTAVATLQRIVSPPATPEIMEAADALVPQVAAAKAAKMSPTDPARKAAYQDALAQFDAFIKKYPQSTEVESATYGKAVAAFQNQDFDTAMQSLQDNLKRFPSSTTILDSEDMLAVILMAQANTILAAHGDEHAAMRKFDDALRYLADIIGRHSDVALSNDAQFQAGELLFNRANAETGDKRTKDLTDAISVYHAVLPKDMMVQAEQARVASILQALRQAQYARNPDLVQTLQHRQDHENGKLEALKNAPDQTLNAQLRVAASYFLLQKYDEARVLLRYLQDFAQDEQQKKQIQYYMVLTYASQGLTDKAVAAYNDFQAKYKGDPLAENLPIAMGTAFLKANQPDKAIAYFKEETDLYPNSPLVNEALGQQAAALIGLKRFDDALATYQKFIATNPPKDQAAQADIGIAEIYQSTQKLPEAVKQYQKVVATYPGTPQAEQSAFYAAGLDISVDMKAALTELQAFAKQYPDSKFTAQAMMMIGQVQAALGNSAGALQAYKDVVSKFPNTDIAPQAYFAQAGILEKDGKNDDLISLMRDFIKKYCNDKDIYYAYDTIGQTQVTSGKIPDAIATYTEMADKHADNPMAPASLQRTVELWQKQATALGRYLTLNDSQRKDWTASIDKSLAAGEKLLDQFPDSADVGTALDTMLADQELLLAAQLKTPDDIDKYFNDLAGKFGKSPSARSRILFTLATFTYGKEPTRALVQMADAYNPSLVYAPAELDIYGEALIDQNKPDDAYKIYQKIAADYPNPPNVQPAQAPLSIQQAQAIAMFGMGSALGKQGKSAEAGKLMTQLKALYPWSPKVLEANFDIAKSLIAQNKFDDALALLAPIEGNRNVPAKLRAEAMLVSGDVQTAKGNTDAAIDTYLKTAAFYTGVPDVAAEASWKGGQMLEKQAATLTEQTTPKKSEQIAKAVTAYKTIVSQFPNSQYVQQAEDRLTALPAR